MKRSKPIVAIDGPVGVGKSTVARRLAECLNFVYIDTGAMYRAVTLKAMRSQIEPTDIQAVADLASATAIRLDRINGQMRTYCDEEDVSEEIRLPEVSTATAPVADNIHVRERLVALQQELGKDGGVVMEGRDISTVVFPDAEIKIYLDADPKVRAQRRFLELQAKGNPATYEETLASLIERDRRDRSRPIGALKIADGAIVVDTTYLNQEQVIQKLACIVQEHPVKRK